MKVWVLIASLMTTGVSARADEVDVALNRALHKLHENWRVGKLRAHDQIDAAAGTLVFVGLTTEITGRYLRWIAKGKIPPGVEKEILRPRLHRAGTFSRGLGGKVMASGLVLFLLGDILRGAELVPRPPVKSAAFYKGNAYNMNYFFGLPLEEQFKIARSDQDIYQFVMELERSYDVIKAGHPTTLTGARP